MFSTPKACTRDSTRRRPTSTSAIPSLMYDRALRKATDASQALIYTFHDVESIWQKISVTPAIENQYYCLNRPRNLEWWPTGQADQIFLGTPYNYSEYKQMWWDFLCKDNSDRAYVPLLKFGICLPSQVRICENSSTV